MTPGIVTLCRSEIGHLADVLEVLVARHRGERGGSRRYTFDELHLRHETEQRILGRAATLRILPGSLQALAIAAGEVLGQPVTVEQLLAGVVRLPPSPPPSKRPGRFASSTRGAISVRGSSAR